MSTLKVKIKNCLKSLNELENVSVEVSGGSGQVLIYHSLHHAADFKFKWVDGNHYVGYFVDASGKESQAIVSLWSAIEAVKFTALYATFIELRAKREPSA